MGSSGFNSHQYSQAVDKLQATGQVFHRSSVAQQTGNFSNVAEILNPRKLKNGMRESCFAPGFNDATPIVVSIDGTGSMEQVPFVIQKELPTLMDLLTGKGVTDHPNILFMCHDDEVAIPPDAAFQMSQFETGAPELIASLNEMVVPHLGGGNCGEAYHLSIYAAANHTRLEAFERDGTKGFFFMICDEEPFYEAGDPTVRGTSPAIAKEVFGDSIGEEVSMLASLKKLCERYHVFVIRPGHTMHGRDKTITRRWQDLLQKAGENREHVLEIAETDAIISTIALAIGRLAGADESELVDVLRSKGAAGVDGAIVAVKSVSQGSGMLPAATSSAALATGGGSGRRRR